MPTFMNKALVEDIIRHDGFFEDDPPVYRITEFVANTGDTCWGVDYTPEWGYNSSSYVHAPTIIWEKK